MPLGLGSKVALGSMAGAGAAGILAPEFLFGISYLSGDPDWIRDAANVHDDIADRIDKTFQDANKAATAVWKDSSGEPVSAFKRFWEKEYGPAVYKISVKHRNMAQACRAYAKVVEDTNQALKVLCWIMTVDMMFTIGYQVLTWKILAAVMKRQALLLKEVSSKFVKMLLPTFMYWTADSAAYAAGEVAFPLALNYLGGIKTDMSGAEVRSVGYNATAFREHFIATVLFNGVIDGGLATMAKIPGVRVLAQDVKLPNGVVLNTATTVPRFLASISYSGIMDVQHGDNPLPGAEKGLTEEEMYQKFIVHGTRTFFPRPPKN
ncbi:WXG100-like domain-containing protein [Nonomuraea cavernae]|uniref:Outer membrane channel protein CpnT-like N-terminal domain-containing protein n=1 Tax=Nonomuraea cavernae TaxID=2045107 RepID=A0A917Z2F6_9ACTN|nr:hypothetical protein [Nonomuraea cavernae]MCA2188550.1 hypothetical protein [Nonomuraea cavernae]GGO72981.1 hypothetical protein GCM10012289_42310 [Nonomuraea cavernae]